MPPSNLSELVGLFINLIRAALPVVISLAFLAFLWGIVKFISRVGGDEKAVTEGKKFMLWSVIALFILISVWGILRFFSSSIGFNSFGIPQLP